MMKITNTDERNEKSKQFRYTILMTWKIQHNKDINSPKLICRYNKSSCKNTNKVFFFSPTLNSHGKAKELGELKEFWKRNDPLPDVKTYYKSYNNQDSMVLAKTNIYQWNNEK